MRRHRAASAEEFVGSALPTTSEEEWRYSRIGELDLDRYAPVTAAPAQPVTLPDAVATLIEATGAGTVVVVTDGVAAEHRRLDPAVTVSFLGDPGAAGSEPVDGHLGDGFGDDPGPAHGPRKDAFLTLNDAFGSPLVIDVPAGSRPDPILVVHWLATDAGATFPRTAFRVGSGAEVDLLEVAVSADLDALTVPVTTVDVGPGANVGYLHVQELGPSTWQVAQQASRVARDATFTSTAVALGGRYARVRTASSLLGAGGTTRLLAVYFGSGSRMVDFRTVQEHVAPRTTSELLFKGAVANRSRAVYTGLIRVEKGAAGTNAFQTNRNLVLHEGARADSVPNLEIEDNDVRCSHASAVGPIAEEQRFYLASRGVPPDAADRLITLGFLDEVLQRSGHPRLADHLRLDLVSVLDAAEREQQAGAAATSGAPS